MILPVSSSKANPTDLDESFKSDASEFFNLASTTAESNSLLSKAIIFKLLSFRLDFFLLIPLLFTAIFTAEIAPGSTSSVYVFKKFILIFPYFINIY